MFQANTVWILRALMVVCLSGLVQGAVTKSDLEAEHGPVQGQMVMANHTILVFESVRIRIDRETGAMDLQTVEPVATYASDSPPFSSSGWMEMKRKIARLPAHEQVHYWKLHQLRHPNRDVTSELQAALDKMEEVRKSAMVAEVEPERESARTVYRSRGYSSYFPTYGYRGHHPRFRRSFHKDTQIGLNRPVRPRKPAESWTTPMSLADRARSEALSKVSGARSAILGNTR